MTIDELITAGQGALQQGKWQSALVAFKTAVEQRESPEALHGLGVAHWWLGEMRASVDWYERAYAAFRRAGDAIAAAGIAINLCITYQSCLGNQAVAGGWIARAERLLQGMDPGPLQGWLWLTRGYHTTELHRSVELARRALEFAQSSGDLDLELCALGDLGKALVALGQVEEGLALVDEAMAGTLGGEHHRLDTVVFTSCSMLMACELAADLERAAQWCRVADNFIQRHGCPFLYAECHALYGGILVATGHWPEAEHELTSAIKATRDALPAVRGLALARLADLRLRQGRLEEAEELLTGVDDEPSSALPSAAISLARGEPPVAIARLQWLLGLQGEHHFELAATLELLVEAHLARGDLEAARNIAARLSALASSASGPDEVAARAAHAAARIASAQGDLSSALGYLERAVNCFSRLNLPLETARVRAHLAGALVDHEPVVAIAEARRALRTFEQLGAAADVNATAEFLRSLGAAGRSGPKHVGTLTRREQEVLRLIAVGLSNPEIAERLCISRKTASHHVSSVLAKLNVRNRAQAVAYATRMLPEPANR